MANFDHYLRIPDKRDGIIQMIISPDYTGVDHCRIFSPDLFGMSQYFKLVSAQISMLASADVGNRYIKLLRYNILRSGTIFEVYRDAIAATESKKLLVIDESWNASAAGFADSIVGVNGLSLGVGGGNYVDVIISGGFAGDSWDAVLEFEYLNRKWGMKEVLPEVKV